jgi:hypothetical protein
MSAPANAQQSPTLTTPAGVDPTQSSDKNDATPLVSTSSINPGDVPEYERGAAAGASIKGTGPNGAEVAHVGTVADNTINVADKSAYTAGDQAHELQHVVQNNATPLSQKVSNILNPSTAKVAGTSSSTTGAASQDYGGTNGLAAHLASGKTVSDLNSEQQAEIPKNYMNEFVKLEKAGDSKGIDKLNKTYEPAIRQLRNMANTSKDTINTTPDAPGAPGAAYTGVAVPVKGMLSNSTKSVALKASDVHNPPPQSSKKAVDTKPKSWYSSGSGLGGK